MLYIFPEWEQKDWTNIHYITFEVNWIFGILEIINEFSLASFVKLQEKDT